jgi:hypothetical protein
MQSEELRALLLQYLGSVGHDATFQWNSCLQGVSRLARERSGASLDPQWQLPRTDMVRLKHVVWDLIIGRIISPGTPLSSDSGWPALSLTDHGQKVVMDRHPVPYDPDGYLARLQHATGGLGLTVLLYLEEALSTFRMSNYLASTVMLGAASEMLFIEISNAVSSAIRDPQERKKFNDRTGHREMMTKRVKAVTDWFSEKREQLPAVWRAAELILLVNNVAELIRSRRNEAGHPQDPPSRRSHEEVYALLCLFPDYCVKLCELRNWLVARAGSID